MAILKNKTQGNYTIVSNGILKNQSLSLKDRGLIITLLSLPDNWAFTINGLSKIIPDGKDSIKNSLKHLEKLGYVSKTQNRGEFGKYGNIVIEVHETPILPIVENPLTENPSTENPLTGKPVPENLSQYNNNKYNTNKSIIHQSIHPSINSQNVDGLVDMDESENYIYLKNLIKKNIEYDILSDQFKDLTDKDILDQIVDLITEICSFAKKDILINGNHIPSALVKTKFLKLDSSNIQYVMEELKKGTSKIKNPHSYLISMLYNAQNTQNVHYQSAVNSDMRNIGSKIYD
mgnify:CR=1 FL=1